MSSHDESPRAGSEVSGDEEIETTFRRLRTDGHSRLEALRVILDSLDVSLREVKSILLTSDTWDEARAAADTNQPDEDSRHSAYDATTPAPAD